MDREQLIKAIEPFALIGGECHDTGFTVRLVDAQQNQIGFVCAKDFKLMFDLYSEIQSEDGLDWLKRNPPAAQSDSSIAWAFFSGMCAAVMFGAIAGAIF